MRVITPDYGEREVLVRYKVGQKEYYLYIPDEDYGGLLAIQGDLCIIVSSDLQNFVLVSSAIADDLEMHFAVGDVETLEQMIDHDQVVTNKFIQRLRDSGKSI